MESYRTANPFLTRLTTANRSSPPFQGSRISSAFTILNRRFVCWTLPLLQPSPEYPFCNIWPIRKRHRRLFLLKQRPSSPNRILRDDTIRKGRVFASRKRCGQMSFRESTAFSPASGSEYTGWSCRMKLPAKRGVSCNESSITRHEPTSLYPGSRA